MSKVRKGGSTRRKRLPVKKFVAGQKRVEHRMPYDAERDGSRQDGLGMKPVPPTCRWGRVDVVPSRDGRTGYFHCPACGVAWTETTKRQRKRGERRG